MNMNHEKSLFRPLPWKTLQPGQPKVLFRRGPMNRIFDARRSGSRRFLEGHGRPDLPFLSNQHVGSREAVMAAFRRVLDSLPREDPISHYREIRERKAGSRIVDWLWSRRTHRMSFLEDVAFAQDLAYVMEAEGLEASLQGWLIYTAPTAQDHVATGNNEEFCKTRVRPTHIGEKRDASSWKGILLAQYLESRIERTGAVEDAMVLFTQIAKIKHRGGQVNFALPMINASMVLHEAMTCHMYTPPPLQVYDDFLETLGHGFEGFLYLQGEMAMYHPLPQKNNPDPFLRLLQAVNRDPAHPLRDIRDKAARERFEKVSRICMWILKDQGRTIEAAWIRSVGMSLIKDIPTLGFHQRGDTVFRPAFLHKSKDMIAR